MAKERSDDQFDMVFAPARYGALNTEIEGRWTALASLDGTPLGIAWSDGEDGAGFIQAGPNELAEEVWTDFSVSAHLKIPAIAAYQLAVRKKGLSAQTESTGKLSEVYRDFSKLLDQESVIAAVAADTAVASDEISPTAHIYITVADEDENQVLELVRNDEAGLFIRDNGEWVRINAEEDNQRVWDRILIDVLPEAAEVYDKAAAAGPVTADQFNDVLAPEEVAQ